MENERFALFARSLARSSVISMGGHIKRHSDDTTSGRRAVGGGGSPPPERGWFEPRMSLRWALYADEEGRATMTREDDVEDPVLFFFSFSNRKKLVQRRGKGRRKGVWLVLATQHPPPPFQTRCSRVYPYINMSSSARKPSRSSSSHSSSSSSSPPPRRNERVGASAEKFGNGRKFELGRKEGSKRKVELLSLEREETQKGEE